MYKSTSSKQGFGLILFLCCVSVLSNLCSISKASCSTSVPMWAWLLSLTWPHRLPMCFRSCMEFKQVATFITIILHWNWGIQMHICRVEQVAVSPAPSLGRHKGELREVKINGVWLCFWLDIPAWHKRLEILVWKGTRNVSQQVLASRVSANSAGNHSLSQQQ